MKEKKLSICIPTYNRAAFLDKTLHSVTSQITNDVDIVISDNGSTDHTKSVVASHQKQCQNIHFFRSAKNLGADRNYLSSIRHARGEFCWLLGSDDLIAPGGIHNILDLITKYPQLSGLSVNRQSYNFTRDKIIADIRPCLYKKNFLFNNWQDCFDHLFLYFGYLSGQIVRRSLWNQSLEQLPIENHLNGYVHVLIIGKMIQTAPQWLYVNKQIVHCRLENDSFLDQGYYKRFEIDMELKAVIAELCGTNQLLKKKIISKLIRKLISSHMLRASIHLKDEKLVRQIKKRSFQAFKQHKSFWTHVFFLAVLPVPIVKIVRFIYRILLKPYKTQL